MNPNDKNEEEISLIDIAKTLILRKWWLLGIFLISLSISVVIAYRKQTSENTTKSVKQWKYTTYIVIGSYSLTYPIEPLPWIEIEIKEIFLNDSNIKLPLEVEYDTVKMCGNGMKVITVLPQPEKGDELDKKVQEFHLSILKPLLIEHENLLKPVREAFVKTPITSSPFSAPTRIAKLAHRTEFTPPTPRLSSPKIIILLGVIIGVFSGLFGVFFVEFFIHVKNSLKEL